MIEFRIGAHRIRPSQFARELEKVTKKAAQEQIEKKLRGIRDPKTGAKPRVTPKGKTPSDLSFQISGSEGVMEEVKKRLK